MSLNVFSYFWFSRFKFFYKTNTNIRIPSHFSSNKKSCQWSLGKLTSKLCNLSIYLASILNILEETYTFFILMSHKNGLYLVVHFSLCQTFLSYKNFHLLLSKNNQPAFFNRPERNITRQFSFLFKSVFLSAKFVNV